jgi:hypothetical protein
MNSPSIRPLRRLGATMIAGLLASTAFSQGSLTPPLGVPGPTQKTLQQIWDKIDALETQTRGLQDQVGTLQNDSAALGILLDNAGVVLPWRTTVATNTLVIYHLNDTNHAYFSGSLSLAISPQGEPAVSWRDQYYYNLAAAEGAGWESARWLSEELVGPTWRTFFVNAGALGFLPSGEPVIAGFETTQGVATQLVLKALAGVATNLLSFAGTADSYYPQLIVSPRGHPEICYMQDIPPASVILRILQWTGSGWTNTVAATNMTDRAVSMAVSSDSQIGITYQEDGTYHTRLAYRVGNVFTNGLVTAETNYRHALAFAPSGQPALAYWGWDGFGFTIKLATLSPGAGGFDTGVWGEENIESGIGLPVGGVVGLRVSIAFGPSGRPAIAYSHPELGVRYASKSSSGTWDITQVAPPATIPDRAFDSVLRFNRTGQPVIAYWDQQTDSIKIATRAPYIAP